MNNIQFIIRRSCLILFLLAVLFPFSGYSECTLSDITASPANATICQGNVVILTYMPDTAGTNYRWYRNGTLIQDSIRHQLVVSQPGTYTMKIFPCATVSNSIGVVINPLPNPIVTGSASVCAGSMGVMYSTSPHAGYAYFWTVSGGTIASGQNTNQITVNWGSAGAGTVSVTDTIVGTGCYKTVTKDVTVNPMPTPVNFTFTTIGNPCFGNFHFETSSPPVASGLTYSWNFGDATSGSGNTSTDRNPNHRFNAYGNTNQQFEVRLIVTTSFGCKDSITKTVTVTQRPNAVLLNDPPFYQCLPTPGNFELTVFNWSTTQATNTGYEITWGDGSPKEIFGNTFSSTMHTYIGIGSFYLIFKAIGQNGCYDSTIYLVFNGSNPKWTIGNPGNLTGCTNGSSCYSFPISDIEDNISTSYHFDFGDGTILTYTQADLPASVSHCYTQPSCNQPNAAYKLVALAINPCDTSRTTIEPIRISAPTIAEFTNPAYGCITVPVTFTNTSQNNCYITGSLPSYRANYKWYVDGVLIQNNPNVLTPPNLVHAFTSTGNHNVCLVGWNACNINEHDSICHPICIDPIPSSAFTLSATSGCADFEVTVTNNNSTTENPCGTLQYTWIVDNYAGSALCPPNSSLWQFKAGSDLHSATPTFIFTNPGTYRISLAVSNACGSVASSQTITTKVKPTVTVAVPATICSGESSCPTVTYSSCLGTIESYLWDFTGGVSADPTIQNSCATYTTANTYPITASAVNECGTTVSEPVDLVVKPLPIPTIIGPDPVCSTTAGYIYSTESGAGIAGWIWAVTGGTINSGGGTSTISVTWGAAGPGTISVNYLLNNCQAAAPTFKNIIINPRPLPTITGINSTCEGTTGVTYATEPGMTGYVWSIIGGTITSGLGTAQITVTWTTSGNQKVCVNYTNGNGCTGSIPTCYSVLVNPLPLPIISGVGTACLNDSKTYTTETGMTNYVWTVSTGGSITSGAGTSSVIVNWTSTGNQTLFVTYTNGNGCNPLLPSTKSVTVNPLANPVISGPDQPCENSTVTYTTETGMTNYVWEVSVGGSITSGAGTAVITVNWTSVGTRSVSVNYNLNNCPAPTPTVYPVTVNPRPTPTISGGDAYCAGTSGVIYSAEAGMNGYTWLISAGGIITSGSGTNSIAVNWITTGAQWISVNYSNSFNCTASSATVKPVTVNPVPSPTITGPAAVCINSSINYYTETGMTEYTWTAPGGAITSGAGTNVITVTWNSPNVYQLTVTYKNIHGCQAAAPVSKTVTVNSLPNPTISGPNEGCKGVTQTYTTQAGMSDYNWSVSAGGMLSMGPWTNIVTVLWTTSGAQSVSVNYSQAGCPASSSFLYDVTVYDPPVPIISGPADVCIGAPGIVYSTESGMTEYSWSIIGGVFLSGESTSSVNVSWNTTGTRTICVNYTNSHGCAAASPTCYSVTVNPLPAPTISGPLTPCAGSTGNGYSTQTGMAGYNWLISSGGLITGGVGTNAITVDWTTDGLKTVSVNYTNSFSCTLPSAYSIDVNVIPIPVGSATPSSLMVCNNQSFTIALNSDQGNATTYSWSASFPTTLVGISNGNGSPVSTSYKNIGNTPEVVRFTVIPTFNGCTGSPFYCDVTVNPVPQVANTILTQTISSGSSTSTVVLTSTASGGTTGFSWTGINSPNPPPSIPTYISPGTGDLPVQPLTNVTFSPATLTYTITPTINGCSGPSKDYVITVNPSPDLSITPASQTRCSGLSSDPVLLNSNVNGTTFSWSATTIPSGVIVPIPSGTGNVIPSQAFINNSYIQGTIIYTVTPSLNGIPGAPLTCEIIINPKPDVIFSPPQQTLCTGDPSTIINLTSHVSGTTFGWKARSFGPIVSGSFAQSGSGDIPVQHILNTGLVPGTVTYAIGPLAACPGDSVYYTITVNPRPAVTATPATQEKCSGTATEEVVLSSTIATATFHWYAQASSINIAGFATSGTGNILPQSISTTELVPGTVTYYIFATSHFGQNCNGDTIIHVVTVNPRPVMTSIPTSQTICSGNATQQINFSSNIITGTNYTWVADATGSIQGYTPSGAIDHIPSQTAIVNSSNFPEDLTYTITPWANLCDGTPVTAIIEVLPVPDILNVSTSEQLCSGDLTTGVTFISSVAGADFKWRATNVSTVTPPLSGFPLSGYGDLPVMAITNNSHETGTIIYQIFPFILRTATDTCFGLPFTFTFTIFPIPDVVSVPSSPQTICSGIPPSSEVVLTSNVSNTTFMWVALTPPPELSSFIVTGTGNIPAQVIYNTANVQKALVYTITPTANGCPGPSVEYTILVNPLPIILFTPPGQVTCSGEQTEQVDITSSVEGTTYTWTASSVPGVTGFITSGSGPVIPPQTIYNLNDILCQVVYTIVPAASNCSGLVLHYYVDVSPLPSVTNSPMSDTICSGGISVPVTLTSNVSGASFSWIANPGPGITGATASGSNFIPAQTLYNAYNIPGYVDYVITPISHLGKECTGSIVNYRIIVRPEPHLTNTVWLQETCSGELTDEVILMSDVTGTIFQWTSVPSSGVLGSIPAGTGNIPPHSLTTSDPGGGTVTYTIIPTIGNCQGTIRDYVFHVNPTPEITNTILDYEICSGESASIALLSNMPGVEFSWTATVASGFINGFTPIGINDTILDILTNTGTTPGVVAYRVVPTLNGCSGSPVFFFVTVNAPPSADYTYSNIVCLGETTHFYDASTANSQGGITWQWNFDDLSSGANNTSTLQNPVHVFNSAGSYHVRLVVTNANNCRDTIIRILYFNPVPVPDFAYSGQCYGQTTQFTDQSTVLIGSLVRWEWNFGDPGTGLMNTSLMQNPTHVFSASGTYSVSLTVSNDLLCSKTIVKTVVISPVPVANFSVTEHCTGDITVFKDLSNATSSPIIQWDWNFGDNNTLAYTVYRDSVNHLYTNPGQYNVTLTVQDGNGCSHFLTKVVHVLPPPSAMFQFSPACASQITYFTDYSNGSGSAIQAWSWNFGDPASS
ncbi:MAG: PKD domain-containing protein, partial [Bacteroidetes bacterium]|nr:PKD domain-containing protein [Bacteroidota bacterium]